MKRKKTVCAFLAAGVIALFAGCSSGGIGYYDGLNAESGFDKSLFYSNVGAVQAADPSVITVDGTYYLYATNAYADGDCSYIQGYKSTDLTDWEQLGPVFTPARDAWAVSQLWAPEVIEKDGTYYMYYSGYNGRTGRMGISVAVADQPGGPFREYEGAAGGGSVDRKTQLFDFGFPAIDPSPFVDEDGRAYLYFSKDQVDGVSSVCAVELESDMVSVKAGTLSQDILVPSEEWETPSGNRWNEAPFLLKRNGKYYLMYSGNYYESKFYSVGVAVSDLPTSDFVKQEGGPVLGAESDWAFVSGTGHNCVFPSADGSELFFAYHSHVDTEYGGSVRKIAFDRIVFDGDLLHVNGPSISPQLLPSGSGEYANVADRAEVSATGSGSETGLLTDGIVNYRYATAERYEWQADKKATVTLTFAEPVTVKAVLVYDSADYERSLSAIASIELGQAGTIKNVKFSPAYRYVDSYDFPVKIPGSCAYAEFEPVAVTKIVITFKQDRAFSLNEIVVAGKSGGEKA